MLVINACQFGHVLANHKIEVRRLIEALDYSRVPAAVFVQCS
jgi:hypothetical protein